MIRWKMCFRTILCSIISNPVTEILPTKNQRRIDCNRVSKFWDISINTFLGLRFQNGMMQGIDTFLEFFKISKCDLTVLMRGQLSSMLLKMAVCIYKMGIIPWTRNVLPYGETTYNCCAS